MDQPKSERRRWRPAAVIPGYVSEHDLAVEFGICVATLRTYRWQGTGPRWTKVGGRVYYSRQAVADYLRSREVQPPREPKIQQMECTA